MKKEFKIVTMSKRQFDKLSPAKKRIAVARDVLDRIELGQLTPNAGLFCKMLAGERTNLKIHQQLESTTFKCEVCAKGGLFLSYIGIVNNYPITIGRLSQEGGEHIYSEPMEVLSEIFSKKQLAYIETAFEEHYYYWNVDLTAGEMSMCENFCNDLQRQYVNNKINHIQFSEKKIKRILKNIIANNGTFNPQKKIK